VTKTHRPPRARIRQTFGLLCAVAIAIGVLALSKVGFVTDAEHWTADWRTALFSTRMPTQHDAVALVLITEDTLEDQPVRLPMDRHMLAKLVRVVASARPAAIGLDSVFTRPTDPSADADLLSAIREADVPIVLGSVDERIGLKDKQLQYHRWFLQQANRPAGHVFFERPTDQFGISDRVIRQMAEPRQDLGAPASFAEMLARVKHPDAKPHSLRIAWLLQPYDGSEPFFALDAGDLLGPADEVAPLLGGLKNKIVLIGSDLVDVDRHLTPLSVLDESRMPGVKIHAQIVAQLVDGRWLRQLTVPEDFLLLVAISLAGYGLSRYFGLAKYPKILALAGSVILLVAGVVAFKFFYLILPYTTALTTWVASIGLGAGVDKLYLQTAMATRFLAPKRRLRWNRIYGLGTVLGRRYWRGRLR
jgi:adenylate cyclase